MTKKRINTPQLSIEGSQLVNLLQQGGVGVLPTDTLYGLVGMALNPKTVERIYQLKGRAIEKPFIVLVASSEQLTQFGINLQTQHQASKYWPGPTSVILPCKKVDFEYLHRGKHSLAFRQPSVLALQVLLAKTGPLVAPSANPEGKPPAATIAEANAYFDNSIDFYVEGGRLAGKPSRLISLMGNHPRTIRN